jgi:hypothetical protein
VLTSSLVARRIECGAALHFGEDVPVFEDVECFGRIASRGKAAFFDCETAWQHGHAGERISERGRPLRVAAEIKVLERVWGADPAFLAVHDVEYRRVLDDLHRSRVGDLIVLGQLREARDELALMQHPPLIYRVLARLPAPLVSLLMGLRDWLGAAI